MAAETTLLDPRKADEDTTTTVSGPIGIRSLSLTVIAIVAAIFALQYGQQFFIPLVIAVLVSYALDPVVSWIARRGVPRAIAAAVVLLLVVGSIGGGAYGLRGEVITIVQQLPEAAQRLRQAIRKDRQANRGGTIEQVQKAASELSQAASEATVSTPPPKGVLRVQVEEPAVKVSDYLWWSSANILAFAGQAVSVLFLVYFMLMSGDLFKRKLVKLVGPSLEKKKITVQILNEIDVQIERFLFVRVVTSVVVGVATWLAFRYIGVQNAGVWGMAAGVFNSIPYFGPVIVAAGTAVVGFLQFGTIGMAAYVSGVSLVITSIEGWLLTPWLTSKTAKTNEVAIFVGLIFWSFVWGIWGTLLAVPMLVAVKACCDRIEDLKPIGEMLGE